tara:strand:+ start:97 stop:1041 length:945 start_codon:yes stop_codon:yes gene_type:complete
MASRGFRDYFHVLGLDRNANETDIKQAFRTLARKYHPDVNPENKEAEAKFKEVSEAYEVLSDPEKRRRYEQFGQYWNQGAGMGSGASQFDIDFGNYGNFDDFINDLLGRFGGVRGSTDTGFSGESGFSKNVSRQPINLDAEIKLKISFLEAFRGTERTLAVNNERVQVKIPEGIKSGSRLRVKGKGNIQPGKGRRGDLYLIVEIAENLIWRLEGEQLRADLPVTFDEIALGAKIKITIPDGEAEVNIPQGTIPGQNLRLKGKGWPSKMGRGDLILTIKMQLPLRWSSEELEIIEQLRRFRSFDPRKDWFQSAKL